jgi:hypothetical protein
MTVPLTDPEAAAAAFAPPLLPCPIDQDAPHGLGRDAEEVLPVVKRAAAD